MNPVWLKEGEPWNPTEDELRNWQGFVYLITDESGRMYVGQKSLWKKVTRPPLKGRRNKRRSIAESDWRTYVGSSPAVKEMVEERGIQSLRREILHLGKTKGDLSYLETKEQFDRGVLFDDNYYNEVVNCRIHMKHLSEEIRNDYREPKGHNEDGTL